MTSRSAGGGGDSFSRQKILLTKLLSIQSAASATAVHKYGKDKRNLTQQNLMKINSKDSQVDHTIISQNDKSRSSNYPTQQVGGHNSQQTHRQLINQLQDSARQQLHRLNSDQEPDRQEQQVLQFPQIQQRNQQLLDNRDHHPAADNQQMVGTMEQLDNLRPRNPSNQLENKRHTLRDALDEYNHQLHQNNNHHYIHNKEQVNHIKTSSTSPDRSQFSQYLSSQLANRQKISVNSHQEKDHQSRYIGLQQLEKARDRLLPVKDFSQMSNQARAQSRFQKSNPSHHISNSNITSPPNHVDQIMDLLRKGNQGKPF